MAGQYKGPISTEIMRLSDIQPPATLQPVLVVIAGPATGAMYRLEQHTVVIGREDDCDIIIDDQGVSRNHCRLVRRDHGFEVEDGGSTNGTYVNYRRIERAPLRDGDRIRLGQRTIVRFALHDEVEEAYQRNLYEAAVRDPLTGAYNKRYFLDRLEEEFAFAARHATSLSLLVLDVDHLGAINEEYGHPVGDSVLGQLVVAMRARSRAEDVFARLEGGLFGILARGIQARQAHAFGERLRTLVAGHAFQDAIATLALTVSVGTATLKPPASKNSSAELMAEAEAALRTAKQSGRNRVEPVPKRRVARDTML